MAKTIKKTITNEEVIKGFYNYLRNTKQVEESTIEAYRPKINKIVEITNNKPFSELEAEDIMELISEKKKDCKAKTVNHYIIMIGVFNGYLNKKGINKRDFMEDIKKMKEPKPQKRPLTPEEFNLMLGAISEKRLNYFRDRLILNILYYTGIRIGELLNIVIRDIDLKNGVIEIKAEGTKTKAGRNVYLPPQLVAELGAYINDNNKTGKQLLITTKKGGEITDKQIRRMIGETAEQAGLNRDDITPHTFRHAHATELYKRGVDVLTISKLLGHSNPQTTMKIYIQFQEELKLQAVKKLWS